MRRNTIVGTDDPRVCPGWVDEQCSSWRPAPTPVDLLLGQTPVSARRQNRARHASSLQELFFVGGDGHVYVAVSEQVGRVTPCPYTSWFVVGAELRICPRWADEQCSSWRPSPCSLENLVRPDLAPFSGRDMGSQDELENGHPRFAGQ